MKIKDRSIIFIIAFSIILSGYHYSYVIGSTSTETTIMKKDSVKASSIFYVGGSGPNNYSKIQDAIDNASDGDIVFVFHDSSPYKELINIKKSIQVIGENRNTTIIDSNIVYIEGNDITFTGFTARILSIYQSNRITVTDNILDGIWLGSSIECVFFRNFLLTDGFSISCTVLHDPECWTTHIIDSSNTLNGKPIYYLKNIKNITVPSGASQIILANCTNMIIENQDLELIHLGFSKYNHIMNNSIKSEGWTYSLWLQDSMENTIEGNIVSNLGDYSINLYYGSENNILINNTIKNSFLGVQLLGANQNIVQNNHIINNNCGIEISDSSNNSIIGNIIDNNTECGLASHVPLGNIIAENIISNNSYGLYLASYYPPHETTPCSIYHNTFLDNNCNAYGYGGSDTWNSNYWDDYTGADEYHGHNQDIPGCDGLGDTPYIIPGEQYTDYYPLMEPWKGQPSVQITTPKDGYIYLGKHILMKRIWWDTPAPPISIVIGPIPIQVNVTSKRSIEKVEFYVDNILKATDTKTPYSWMWKSLSTSAHMIKIVAYDNEGYQQTLETKVWKFF
jgi:parallel beta-helix repeat protein